MRGVDQVGVQETRTVPDGRSRRGLRSILHRPRRRPFHYTLTGLAGAVVFLCLSLTPSLLPRTGLTQGLISGITAAFGYGAGVLAANVWDAFAGREARPARRRTWLVFLGVAVAAYVAATVVGRYWQARIRALMDAPPDSALSLVVVLFEGRDAAGKGGAIQRITETLNPRAARVVALAAPVRARSTSC